jgi:hypothetical protein
MGETEEGERLLKEEPPVTRACQRPLSSAHVWAMRMDAGDKKFSASIDGRSIGGKVRTILLLAQVIEEGRQVFGAGQARLRADVFLGGERHGHQVRIVISRISRRALASIK